MRKCVCVPLSSSSLLLFRFCAYAAECLAAAEERLVCYMPVYV